jgi:hypothetical protein
MAVCFDYCDLQKSACKAIHMIAQKYSDAGVYLGAEGACEAVIAAILKYSISTSIAK